MFDAIRNEQHVPNRDHRGHTEPRRAHRNHTCRSLSLRL